MRKNSSASPACRFNARYCRIIGVSLRVGSTARVYLVDGARRLDLPALTGRAGLGYIGRRDFRVLLRLLLWLAALQGRGRRYERVARSPNRNPKPWEATPGAFSFSASRSRDTETEEPMDPRANESG